MPFVLGLSCRPSVRSCSLGGVVRGVHAAVLELLFLMEGVLPAELAPLLLLELVGRLQTFVRRVVAVPAS